MGKPFKKELTLLSQTIDWAELQNIKELQRFFYTERHLPLLAVGSGGSLSACHYASLLYENKYYLSKAITPFDFFYSEKIVRKAKVLFISASGKNTDIQFAFKKNRDFHTPIYGNLSMCLENPLEQMSNETNNTFSINYDLPTGKDGFLATNSLVAFFVLLYRAFDNKKSAKHIESLQSNIYLEQYTEFCSNIETIDNFTVLYGGWGLPIAFDIESKFTEAALGAVQLSDYRNFGHGRHHWFDKKNKSSSIIAIVTPREKKIAEKTLALIPNEIPKLIIETNEESSLGTIDLLLKSFHFVSKIGDVRKIDPGKPGVPSFGSKLYNLKYTSLYKASNKELTHKDISILRKAHVSSLQELSQNEKQAWFSAYDTFISKISTTIYSGIVFDYDGTLCKQEERLKKELNSDIRIIIEKLLSNNIKVGIVTGRGKSIKEILRKSLPQSLWRKLYIGYYNGSDIGTLDDDSLPNTKSNPEVSLKTIQNSILNEYILNVDLFKIDLRPSQLTITSKDNDIFSRLRVICHQAILAYNIKNVIILESSHSLDIIIRPNVSKLNIIKYFFQNEDVLCIGDKGCIPGNDSELLSTSHSLSVDQVSHHPKTCWNLLPEEYNCTNSIMYYLNRISIIPNKGFKLDVVQ